MPKTISGGLSAHLQLEATTLATCWRLTRPDGVEFFLTDHDTDLLFESNLYLSAVGYERSAIQSTDKLAPDNLDLRGILDNDVISTDDLRAGLFDYSQVKIFAVNYEDLAQGSVKLKAGRLGEVTLQQDGTFQAEFRGLAQAFSTIIGEVTTPECRVDLGSPRCGIPIAPAMVQRSTAYVVGAVVVAGIDNRIHICTTAGTTAASAPAYNGTVAGTTNDGSAVFTTQEAFTRVATVSAVTDPSSFEITVDEDRDVTGWFDQGLIQFTSGANAGVAREVRSWTKTGDDTGDVLLFLPFPFEVAVSDELVISPGCLKRLEEDCRDKFDNVINYQGEPFLPGADEVLKIPDAR